MSKWYGYSGAAYEYNDTPITFGGTGGPLGDSIPANYIFSRLVNGEYRAIYIGETKNLLERIRSHEKMPCIRANEATHFHYHYNSDEYKRLYEEKDLTERYRPSCNG